MRRTDIDGVPVFWTDGPPPFTAGLVFGVGRRDETFLAGGLTHLVEHLIMGSLGRSTLDANASVDLHVTEFVASGRPQRVADFFGRVCQALTNPPLHRVSTEANVLRVEDGHVQPPVIGALLAEQYGAVGVGLAGFRDPALLALSQEQVEQWLRTWFVGGNAAMWLSGPPPERLRLPLPAGPAPTRAQQRRRELPLPALVEIPMDGAVAVGADLERAPGLAVALSVLRSRVEEELRHQRGLSYTVASDQVHVEGARRFAVVTADVRDDQEAVAARALWRALRGLADEGPDAAELAHEQEVVADYLADPRSAVEEARATATGLVAGMKVLSSEELAQESASVTAEQVRAAAAQLRARALVAVPDGVDLALPDLSPLPPRSAEPVDGRRFRRRRGSAVPSGADLRVGGVGVSLVLDQDKHITVRYADAIGLVQLGLDEWSLIDRDGTAVPLTVSDWRDGQDALTAVRAAVPAELQAAGDELSSHGQAVLLAHAPAHLVAQALWPSKRDAWTVRSDPWTLIWREGKPEDAYVDAAGISAGLGRHGAVLLLTLQHGELTLVLNRRGKEIDRHIWSGQEHDPTPLAQALDADPATISRLLAESGAPSGVLAELAAQLRLPPQTSSVLLGSTPEDAGLRHEPARGVRATMSEAMRGEFDPPDSNAWHHRLTRWRRERSPAYRAVNGVFAVSQAGIAALLAGRVDGNWTSWSGGLAAFFAIGTVTSLWEIRPSTRTEEVPSH